MNTHKISVNKLRQYGNSFIGNTSSVVYRNGGYKPATELEGDINLSDYFEDPFNPTETEMSLFELERGYKLEFV